MNTMYDTTAAAQVKCGQINGPTPVLAERSPMRLSRLAVAFPPRRHLNKSVFAPEAAPRCSLFTGQCLLHVFNA